MKTSFALHGLIALSLLAAGGIAQAADNPAPAVAAPARHAQFKRFDPVKHARKRLDGLEAKLNLKDEQRAAWKTYADAALARARERAARMQGFHGRQGGDGRNLDTASKLDKAADRMRARADDLKKVAQDTRAFQEVLGAEQQSIFDLYWAPRGHGMRGGHHPA
jgi:hypothetical protein